MGVSTYGLSQALRYHLELNELSWTMLCELVSVQKCKLTEEMGMHWNECMIFLEANVDAKALFFPPSETSMDTKAILTAMTSQACPAGSHRHLTRPKAKCQSGRSGVLPSCRLHPSEGKLLLREEGLPRRKVALGGRQMPKLGRRIRE